MLVLPPRLEGSLQQTAGESNILQAPGDGGSTAVEMSVPFLIYASNLVSL